MIESFRFIILNNYMNTKTR